MIQAAAEAGKFSAFVVTTLWVHGPWSPLLPAAYEPVLMLYGKWYPPWLIALTGATLSCVVEWINYRVYDWISDLKRLEHLKQKATSGRFVRLFQRQPFLVVWIFAWSPLPDWAARIMGVLAGYPVSRYVAAFWLGRLPKFLFLAWLGKQLPLTALQLTVLAVATVVVGYGVAWMRRKGWGRWSLAAGAGGCSLALRQALSLRGASEGCDEATLQPFRDRAARLLRRDRADARTRLAMTRQRRLLAIRDRRPAASSQ